MHANAQLLQDFYQAFQQRDAETMAACYSPDVQFSDAVFIGLQGSEVGDMWRMLTAKAKNFSLVFDGIKADEQSGEAHWVATYTFSQTGNTVVNDIRARFIFRDGKIISHTDSFDLWRWSSQALGLKGKLLGWTPLVQNAIRKQARKGLADYRRELGR
jgi:ketosteroid isomerase-like protein